MGKGKSDGEGRSIRRDRKAAAAINHTATPHTFCVEINRRDRYADNERDDPYNWTTKVSHRNDLRTYTFVTGRGSTDSVEPQRGTKGTKRNAWEKVTPVLVTRYP